jgi:hypothetical protein
MDPVTMVVAALAAGAGAGVKDAATQAVKDAYAGLKAMLAERFRGNQSAELVLRQHEDSPQTWEAPLTWSRRRCCMPVGTTPHRKGRTRREVEPAVGRR